jgi:putative RecB family exonuclease
MITQSLAQLDDMTHYSGGIFDYVSPSRLNLWLRCPLAFRLKYIEGIRPPPSISLLLGQRVHWALEQYYRHRQLGITLPADVVLRRLRDSWEAALLEAGAALPIATSDAAREQACQIVAHYLVSVTEEPKPLAVEYRLETQLLDPDSGENLGMPLVGILDLLLPGEAGSVICDFKTSARSTAPLELAHEVQLSCYAYLLRRIGAGMESELQIRSLIKTKSPRVEIHRFPPRSAVQLRRLFALIREYLDAIHAGRFNYRPAWTCSTCDFCQRCASHVE